MQVTLEVQDTQQRPVDCLVKIRRDTVEFSIDPFIVGIADRDVFRAWLRNPLGIYDFDDITWASTATGITISLREDITDILLPPETIAYLSAWV